MGADWSELDIPAAPFDVEALAAALNAARKTRGLSWQGVADEVNRAAERPGAVRPISASTISGLAGRPMGVEGDGVLQMLIWLSRTPESFVPGHPGAARDEARLPIVEPPGLLRFDVPAIHRRLDAERQKRLIAWEDVARQIGGRVSGASLKAMAGQTRTSFPGVMDIARWLKAPCAALTRVSPW